MNTYKFDCGCEVEILDSQAKDMDRLPSLNIDYYNLPDCPRVWDLIGEGKTKGVFQLESNLGKAWAKRVMPQSIDEMSALIAIIRPGTLKSLVDGKSMTQHYADRKHGHEEIEYFHNALEPILKSTYGNIVFQEQILEIAKQIAGFSLQEADSLRKATGKKLPELMAKVKVEFLEGCKKQKVVSEEEAEQIFEWIEKSQKYSFNASHSVSYSTTGYWTAWVKYHFPFHFFTSWLYYAKEKQDEQIEVRQLLSDSKSFNIEICPPSLEHLKAGDFGEFSLYGNKIRFGINNVKNIGKARSIQLMKKVEKCEKELEKEIKDWTWLEFLVYLGDLASNTINGLIQVGALECFGLDRTHMLYEYEVWRKLTKREKSYVKEKFSKNSNLSQVLELLLENKVPNVNRRKIIKDLQRSLIKNPSSYLDTVYKISSWEMDLLGVPLTFNKLDNCDSDLKDLANADCKSLSEGTRTKCILIIEVVSAREYTVKSGASQGLQMAFIGGSDTNGATFDNFVIFNQEWEEFKHVLYEGNTVLIICEKSKRGGYIIKNAKSI